LAGVTLALASALALVTAGSASAATGRPVPPSVSDNAAAQIRPQVIRLTPAEYAQWRRDTATPAERAKVITSLQKAFAGVARISVGAAPRPGGVLPRTISPALASGVTSNHFWIIASYADMADGAIWAGVVACQIYEPEIGYLCRAAGTILAAWAQGWGRASNHGVWAAIYWWPPHITGGRW